MEVLACDDHVLRTVDESCPIWKSLRTIWQSAWAILACPVPACRKKRNLRAWHIFTAAPVCYLHWISFHRHPVTPRWLCPFFFGFSVPIVSWTADTLTPFANLRANSGQAAELHVDRQDMSTKKWSQCDAVASALPIQGGNQAAIDGTLASPHSLNQRRAALEPALPGHFGRGEFSSIYAMIAQHDGSCADSGFLFLIK